MGDASSPHRMQYAALPYRSRQDGEVQVRLITSRETRRWVIPKGWPMKGIAPHKTAAREAYEEAGLLGTIANTAIGLYVYDKRLPSLRCVTCDVLVFPLKVKRYLKKWPERAQRVGFWFSIEAAAAVVHEPELRSLILQFGATMAERYAAKVAAKAQASEIQTVLAPLETKRAGRVRRTLEAQEAPPRSQKRRKAISAQEGSGPERSHLPEARPVEREPVDCGQDLKAKPMSGDLATRKGAAGDQDRAALEGSSVAQPVKASRSKPDKPAKSEASKSKVSKSKASKSMVPPSGEAETPACAPARPEDQQTKLKRSKRAKVQSAVDESQTGPAPDTAGAMGMPKVGSGKKKNGAKTGAKSPGRSDLASSPSV